MRIPTTAILAALAATALATSAQAHAHLVKTSPAADAQVAAPAVLNLTFSEKLEPKFSNAKLMKADGTPVAVKSVAKGVDVNAKPVAPLAAGAYKVMWQAVAADGHKMTGAYSFTVK